MIKEQIFIDGGQLYKEVRVFEGPVIDSYNYDSEGDPIWTFYKETSEGKKEYRTTSEFRNWLIGIESGTSLTGYDLCPSVSMWAGEAYYVGTNNDTELYFRVDNSSLLQDVADYYNLPYPVNTETSEIIDSTPGLISSYWTDTEDVILGSLKFTDGNPSLLKLYAVYKDHDKWSIFNKGRVFSKGEVVEEGAWFTSMSEVKYESESADTKTVFTRTRDQDPLLMWEANRLNKITGETEIEHYESSKSLRTAVANLTSGSDFEDKDKADDIISWLARSYIEGGKEELYFMVSDRAMLDSVCAYYNLEVPYDSETLDVLDNNLRKIRFKSLDLNKLGEGNFVEIVVASVVFINNEATDIRLYEVTRPAE